MQILQWYCSKIVAANKVCIYIALILTQIYVFVFVFEDFLVTYDYDWTTLFLTSSSLKMISLCTDYLSLVASVLKRNIYCDLFFPSACSFMLLCYSLTSRRSAMLMTNWSKRWLWTHELGHLTGERLQRK